MNSQEAMNIDQYRLQKLNAEFGNFVAISSTKALNEEQIKICMKRLADSIGPCVSQYGYRPSQKSKVIIKIPGPLTTCDPRNMDTTVGGKIECELTATKDQYIFYASKIIDELKAECKTQIEKTWQERLVEHLTFLFYGGPEEPIQFEEEYELKRKFSDKRDKFITEIEALVKKFEIPVLE